MIFKNHLSKLYTYYIKQILNVNDTFYCCSVFEEKILVKFRTKNHHLSADILICGDVHQVSQDLS